MRQSIRQLVSICVETLRIREPICEFGSLRGPGQETRANLRPLFPNRKYLGADMRGGPGVDLIADLHQLGITGQAAGTVLLLDTLEHVAVPQKALEEIHRILCADGIVIMSSVMNFPIHNHPSDFWRFTPEAFRILLTPFAECFVGSVGDQRFPHTIIGVGFKNSIQTHGLRAFERRFEVWRAQWHDPMETEFLLAKTARRLTPPAFLEAYRKIREPLPERTSD